jgi:tetratricopeptide (TPR) repeat protein
MKRTIILFIVPLLLDFFAAPVYISGYELNYRAADKQSIIPREQLRPCIELIINGEYKKAEEYIEASFSPTSLRSGFLISSLLYARMGELETTEEQEKFFQIADQLCRNAEMRLKNEPEDIEAKFYLGTVAQYKSVIYAKNGSYLKAIRTSGTGIKHLRQCIEKNPDFPEVQITIGAYHYWSSAKNFLRFLPGISDKRRSGIQQIRNNLKPESISYALGLNQFIWILLHNKELKSAESAVKVGLKKYPGSRFFLYPAAETAKRMGKWKEAANYYNLVAKSLERYNLKNRYFWIKVTLKQAESLVQTGDYKNALQLCRKIKSTLVVNFEKSQSDTLFKRAAEIETICIKRLS